jgi:hypothetical protein
LTRKLSRIAGAILSLMMPNMRGIEAAAQSYAFTNVSEAALQVEVFNWEGKHVRNAEVALTEHSRNQRFQGKTGKDGRLVLRSPMAGSYTLTVSSFDSHTYTQTVELRDGQILSLRVRLAYAPMMGDVEPVFHDPKPSRTALPLPLTSLPAASAPRPMQR